jgi:hypothetical protein
VVSPTKRTAIGLISLLHAFVDIHGGPIHRGTSSGIERYACSEIDANMGPGHVVSVAAGYYLLGAKSCGNNSSFLLRVGHQQVQAVFRELAGVRRPDENRVPAGSGRL